MPGRPGRRRWREADGEILGPIVVALALAILAHGASWGAEGPVGRETLVAEAERAPGPAKGREDAPITIVEFSDFRCGYCRKFWRETLPRLEAEYVKPGKVRFVFRHLAVLGPPSEQAAEAAACAHEQGRFWAYHNALFERGGRQPEDAHLEPLGVDPARLTACVASGRHREQVRAEAALARRLGASGTPTFLIDGKLLIGAHPFETFKRILDAMGGERSAPPSPGAAPRP